MAAESDSIMPLCLAICDVVQLKYEKAFHVIRQTFCSLYDHLVKLADVTPNWDDPENGKKYQAAFLGFLQMLEDALANNGCIEEIDTMKWNGGDKYHGKNVLSMLMDKIMEIISTFPITEVKPHEESCLKTLMSVINKLRNYDRESICLSDGFNPSLPLTIWQAPEKWLSNHPGVFAFSCSQCKDKDAIGKFSLKRSDISTLVHATSTKNLLGMIPLPTLELKGSRGMDTQQNKVPDLTPQGLIYCGVNINKFIENTPPEGIRHMKDKRYGIFELHFDLPSSTQDRRYFNLGTKKYKREFSQQLLVSERPENFWWLSGTKGINDGPSLPFFQRLNETMIDESWEWDVKFCKIHDFWVHPEIVIPDTVKIPWDQVKIKMVQSHKCIENERRQVCYDCEKKCPVPPRTPVDKSWAIKEFANLISENNAWTRIKELQSKHGIFDGALYEDISKAVENPIGNNVVREQSPTKKMKTS